MSSVYIAQLDNVDNKAALYIASMCIAQLDIVVKKAVLNISNI